jgi:hypothetical protein
LFISASSAPVTLVLQAEASALLLAIRIAELLQIHEPHMLTDNSTLATAAAAGDIMESPGHWEIRPLLASITSSGVFNVQKIFHINRGLNFKAHHQAKLARRLQDRPCSVKCLTVSQDSGQCPMSLAFSADVIGSFYISFVKCC